MNRLLCSIIAVIIAIFPSSICARNAEKEYKKLIAEFDVADVVMQAGNATEFWRMLQMTDEQFYKTAKSLASNDNQDLKRDLVSMMCACDEYFRVVPTIPNLYKFTEAVADRSGLRGICPTAILTVTDEPDVAIFSYPNGYFFITYPLYKMLNGNIKEVSALMAAEGVHYTLQHAYAHACYEKSRRNRGRVGRIIGAVGAAIAGVVLDCATGYDGPGPFTELAAVAAVAMVSYESQPRYALLYTPKQIYQADIVAYRYMEWCGFGGRTYIDALKHAGYSIEADMPDAANPDNPSMADRIALLEYLDAHPELREKAKARNRQPRPVPEFTDIFSPRNYR